MVDKTGNCDSLFRGYRAPRVSYIDVSINLYADHTTGFGVSEMFSSWTIPLVVMGRPGYLYDRFGNG